jgi:hypothetical protein
MGYDVDRPWKDLPKKDRDWILFTEETPTVPVYAGFTPAETRAALKRKMEPSYMGTFTGARRYVLHTFANTQSALMKARVPFMEASRAPPATASGSSPRRCRSPSPAWTSARSCRCRWTSWRPARTHRPG